MISTCRNEYNSAETGLYYLQSRYYDPELGRFINADVYLSTGQSFTGFNMFAYCNNNPINRSDSAGRNWFDDLKEKAIETWNTVTDTASNALEVTTTAVSNAWNATTKAATDSWNEIKQVVKVSGQAIKNKFSNIDWGGIGKQTGITAIAGAGSGAVTGLIAGALGAPFTAGMSLPACAGIGALIGGAGGAVEGFLQSFLEEIFK